MAGLPFKHYCNKAECGVVKDAILLGVRGDGAHEMYQDNCATCDHEDIEYYIGMKECAFDFENYRDKELELEICQKGAAEPSETIKALARLVARLGRRVF